MALFKNQRGKDCFVTLQQSHKMELYECKQQGEFIKKVRIFTGGKDSCDACQQLDGKIFTIDEALQKMPIPNKECTFKLYDENRGFCRCSYNAEIEDFE